ncbi:MAG TPA: transporter [Steroidobacteraceae bacterium]|nr:transporter [Steroidobacteraceae bacterium]
MRRLVSTVLLLVASAAHAQELEPRLYANAPVGLNFAIAGYGYTSGGVTVDPSIPLDNAKIEVQSAVLAYAHSFAAWRRSAKFDVIGTYSSLSGRADVAGQPQTREVSGWGDPRLRFSINLHGAPALTLPEMRSYRQDLIVGASLTAWVPVGQYDPQRLVNLGTNRWSLKPELGVSQAFGPWIVELIGAAQFYEDNDDFFNHRTREQEAVYSVQGGGIRSFSSGAWLALFATYYSGGRTTVDGVRGADFKENSRIGLTLTLPVNRNNSVKLYANTGVSTRTGSDFDALGIAWQYRWGGGL